MQEESVIDESFNDNKLFLLAIHMQCNLPQEVNYDGNEWESEENED